MAESDISMRLDELKGRLTLPETKEYQVERLGRLVRKIDDISPACQDCGRLRAQAARLVDMLGTTPLTRAENRTYLFTMAELVSHLKKQHHLVNEGEYLAVGMVVGLVAGATLAFFVHSLFATVGGLALGAVAGAWLDSRARRAGRVI